MKTETILPVLDTEELQKKANEYAMKGAIESIKDFYTGYNSPFRKAFDEHLQKKDIAPNFDLPDIIATINESLSKEVDIIANTAISKTFIPALQRFLTREQEEINFSDLLRRFIKETNQEDYDLCSVDIRKSEYSWLDVTITGEKDEYKITLHEDWETRNEPVRKYKLLSLPYSEEKYRPTMKLSVDNVALELPFTRDILHNEFLSSIARLVIAGTKINIDQREFDEDMFEKECHC